MDIKNASVYTMSYKGTLSTQTHKATNVTTKYTKYHVGIVTPAVSLSALMMSCDEVTSIDGSSVLTFLHRVTQNRRSKTVAKDLQSWNVYCLNWL